MPSTHFVILPRNKSTGERTDQQWHAEYIADSANEDYDRISIQRVATVAFPDTPPIKSAQSSEKNKLFYFVTAQNCFKNMWICLWLHLPFSDLVIGSAKRSAPMFKPALPKSSLDTLLPPTAHIQELFDALFQDIRLLFPLGDDLPQEEKWQANYEAQNEEPEEDPYPTAADLRYYFFS